jgi:succinyl-diaminopimelate desuccinylase
VIGGDAINKVPDTCVIDVDIRYLPGQDAAAIKAAIEAMPDVTVHPVFERAPSIVEHTNPYVRLLADAIQEGTPAELISVGRDGTSDAISFLDAGIPAVEFGPIGAGHHGPDEWVSISSLERYRKALVEFVHSIPKRMGAGSATAPHGHLRIA